MSSDEVEQRAGGDSVGWSGSETGFNILQEQIAAYPPPLLGRPPFVGGGHFVRS